VVHTLAIAKPGGTIMLAGMKGSGRTIEGFSSDTVMLKELTIKGMNGQDLVSVEPALRLIESRKYPLEKMHTHDFALEDAERAIQTLAGEMPGEVSIHSCLLPLEF
jgi:threonine dehydrogenase-like Zn-dependent dehydrogenase